MLVYMSGRGSPGGIGVEISTWERERERELRGGLYWRHENTAYGVVWPCDEARWGGPGQGSTDEGRWVRGVSQTDMGAGIEDRWDLSRKDKGLEGSDSLILPCHWRDKGLRGVGVNIANDLHNFQGNVETRLQSFYSTFSHYWETNYYAFKAVKGAFNHTSVNFDNPSADETTLNGTDRRRSWHFF